MPNQRLQIKVTETIVHTIEVPCEYGSDASEMARVDETSVSYAAKQIAIMHCAGATHIKGVILLKTEVKDRKARVSNIVIREKGATV